MNILRSIDIVYEPQSRDELQSRSLWAGDLALLTEIVAPAGGSGQIEWETVENGWSTAYVLSGSYTATVAAHGAIPAFAQTVSAGRFNHDDRPEWPTGVMVRYDVEPGTRWRCFHQPWLRPSAATQRIFDAPHHIVMPPASILVVVEGSTTFGDGTFVMRSDGQETVVLEDGWAWLTSPES